METTHIEILSEEDKAEAEGYPAIFLIEEGIVYSTLDPMERYPFAMLEKLLRPCLINRNIVYRIEFPDGLRGRVVLEGKDETGE